MTAVSRGRFGFRRSLRRRTWKWIIFVVALVAIAVPTGLFIGPIDWFSNFYVSPTVAYSGDINVTVSATLVGLGGPIPGASIQFVTYPVTGAPPVIIRTSLTGPQGVATIHFIPHAALTLRLFARYFVPGTSNVITSPPAVIQVYLPPTL